MEYNFCSLETPGSPYLVLGASRQNLRSLPTEIYVTIGLRISVLKDYKGESRGEWEDALPPAWKKTKYITKIHAIWMQSQCE